MRFRVLQCAPSLPMMVAFLLANCTNEWHPSESSKKEVNRVDGTASDVIRPPLDSIIARTKDFYLQVFTLNAPCSEIREISDEERKRLVGIGNLTGLMDCCWEITAGTNGVPTWGNAVVVLLDQRGVLGVRRNRKEIMKTDDETDFLDICKGYFVYSVRLRLLGVPFDRSGIQPGDWHGSAVFRAVHEGEPSGIPSSEAMGDGIIKTRRPSW